MRSLPTQMLWSFPPVFSSRSFTLSGPMFNPFWVDFRVLCKIRVQFHSFACGYPVFPASFVEETILSPLCILGTLPKINWLYRHGFISVLSILLHTCFLHHSGLSSKSTSLVNPPWPPSLNWWPPANPTTHINYSLSHHSISLRAFSSIWNF